VLSHIGVILVVCALCSLGCACAAPGPRGRSARESVSLAGDWRFQPDAFLKGEALGYEQVRLDDRRWPLVRIPSSFGQKQIPGMEHYVGAGWFRRSVSVPESWRGRHVVLRFDGVNDHTRVWVNAQRMGEEHNDPYLPFEVPVGPALRFGEENLIAIRVDNFRGPHDLPGHLGWRHFGGILRQVTLEARPAVHIGQVSVVADHAGQFASEVAIVNTTPRPVEATVNCRIEDAGHRAMIQLAPVTVTVEARSTATVKPTGQITSILPWGPDRPILYMACFDLIADSAAADQRSVRFGFRTIPASRKSPKAPLARRFTSRRSSRSGAACRRPMSAGRRSGAGPIIPGRRGAE